VYLFKNVFSEGVINTLERAAVGDTAVTRIMAVESAGKWGFQRRNKQNKMTFWNTIMFLCRHLL